MVRCAARGELNGCGIEKGPDDVEAKAFPRNGNMHAKTHVQDFNNILNPNSNNNSKHPGMRPPY